MKFKIGRLYRVVKDSNPNCIGCILKYEGFNGNYYGKAVKLGMHCKKNPEYYAGHCVVFQDRIDSPNRYRLVEHESMVKFCKKLRKELKNDSS